MLNPPSSTERSRMSRLRNKDVKYKCLECEIAKYYRRRCDLVEHITRKHDFVSKDDAAKRAEEGKTKIE